MPTTVGTFSTLVPKGNRPRTRSSSCCRTTAGGTFTLSFIRPLERSRPIRVPHNASAAFIEFRLENAFDDAGVERIRRR
ncbi:MAG: hypothetical protein R2849_17550 [Thermomicrobiales bacterium]